MSSSRARAPGALAIAASELQRQLNALGLPNAEAIPGEVTRIAKSGTD